MSCYTSVIGCGRSLCRVPSGGGAERDREPVRGSGLFAAGGRGGAARGHRLRGPQRAACRPAAPDIDGRLNRSAPTLIEGGTKTSPQRKRVKRYSSLALRA